MTQTIVRRARLEDRDRLADLRAMLWPEGSRDEHGAELDGWFATGRNGTLAEANFVAEIEGDLAGFVQVGLRSHAEGCDASRPVGYIEGWFVREEFRGRRVGRELLRAAEEWARGQRCREIASDARMDNEDSVRAHAACGYEEVERAVHFRKRLDEE